jgi:hypothetical protein
VRPHLQIHLQDRLSFPIARGLPLRFSDLRIDGERVEDGMPRGEAEGGGPPGQTVEHVGGGA